MKIDLSYNISKFYLMVMFYLIFKLEFISVIIGIGENTIVGGKGNR